MCNLPKLIQKTRKPEKHRYLWKYFFKVPTELSIFKSISLQPLNKWVLSNHQRQSSAILYKPLKRRKLKVINSFHKAHINLMGKPGKDSTQNHKIISLKFRDEKFLILEKILNISKPNLIRNVNSRPQQPKMVIQGLKELPPGNLVPHHMTKSNSNNVWI